MGTTGKKTEFTLEELENIKLLASAAAGVVKAKIKNYQNDVKMLPSKRNKAISEAIEEKQDLDKLADRAAVIIGEKIQDEW